MNFHQALDRHLTAVKERDLETFLDTIVDDGTLTLILPNGNLLESYEEIVELHQDWFADEEWEMQLQLVTTHEASDMASALLLVNYKDVDEDGNPVEFQYFLNLLFAKRGNRWLVVHDQNTVIDIDPHELDGEYDDNDDENARFN